MRIRGIVLVALALLLCHHFAWAQQESEICGPTVDTKEHNNEHCNSACQCPGDGKWCFTPSNLEVTTPNPKWVFTGKPRVDCARNNQGSCEWNSLGAPDRFKITLNNPTDIMATVLTDSRSIGIRLCAVARFYP